MVADDVREEIRDRLDGWKTPGSAGRHYSRTTAGSFVKVS